MTDVSYIPTFHHTDWQDRIDRVEAEGSNGFNNRFNAITADLAQLSTVVSQIGTAIGRFEAPASQSLLISFAPVPRKAPSVNNTWFTDAADGTATASSPSASVGTAVGIMSLTLPGRIRLASMRVVANDLVSSTASVVLSRTPLQPTTAAPLVDHLVEVDLSTSTVDQTQQAFADFALIDPTSFRYFLTLTFNPLAVPSEAVLETVQLTFTPA